MLYTYLHKLIIKFKDVFLKIALARLVLFIHHYRTWEYEVYSIID